MLSLYTLLFKSLNIMIFFFLPALTVPEQVSLSADMYAQQLSISWLGGAAATATFDLMILRTELNETVFYVRALIVFLICSPASLIVQLCYKLVTFSCERSYKPTYTFFRVMQMLMIVESLKDLLMIYATHNINKHLDMVPLYLFF